MPAERIAESLAFINWTVLATLATGSFGAVVAGRFLTEATRGYLAFTAFTAAVFGFLAVLADTGLPTLHASLAVPLAPHDHHGTKPMAGPGPTADVSARFVTSVRRTSGSGRIRVMTRRGRDTLLG